MTRKKNLDLAAEMGEEIDVTEAEANEAREIVPAAPVAAPVAAPSAPLSMSVSDIQAIVTAAITASQQGNQAIADIVTQGIAQARKPIPEGTDASNPKISTLNPLGDRDYPRPLLKCEFFYGTQAGKDKPISRTYQINDEDLSVYEIIALNTLEAGNYTIQRYDGVDMKLSIVTEEDAATDELTRMVLVVPALVMGKKSAIKNMLPDAVNIVRQVTGHDYSKLSKDDLAYFMAEHRKKNYIAVRESVAA